MSFTQREPRRSTRAASAATVGAFNDPSLQTRKKKTLVLDDKTHQPCKIYIEVYELIIQLQQDFNRGQKKKQRKCGHLIFLCPAT